jgi:hypothetical protein
MRIKVNGTMDENTIKMVDADALKDGYTRMEMIEKIVNSHYGITGEVSERKRLYEEIKELLGKAGFTVNAHFLNPHFPPDATLAPHIVISVDKVYSDPVALTIQLQTRDAIVRFEYQTSSEKKYRRYHDYYEDKRNRPAFDNYGFTESINNYNYVIEFRTRLYDDKKQLIEAHELADRFIFIEKMLT